MLIELCKLIFIEI